MDQHPIQILIVDDTETDAFFMEQAFGQSKMKNKVHWVKDGQSAIDFVKKKGTYSRKPRPHIVILDIMMPGKTGLEVLQEMKSNDDICDIPVVMMSASQHEDDVKAAYKKHANAYIPKANGMEDMTNFVTSIENFWFLKARLPQSILLKD